MARKKKPDLDNIFAKTDTGQPEEKPDDPAQSFGVGLRRSEWLRFDEIAAELGQTRHAVALWALRDFLKRWDAGEIRTQTRPSLPKQ